MWGWDEKIFSRITVWHEACCVMTNSDPKGQIFLYHPHTTGIFLGPFPIKKWAKSSQNPVSYFYIFGENSQKCGQK